VRKVRKVNLVRKGKMDQKGLTVLQEKTVLKALRVTQVQRANLGPMVQTELRVMTAHLEKMGILVLQVL